MNDLTTSLIPMAFNISFNESLKQAQTFSFESGTVQTIGNKSVPSLIIDINYQNISQAQYDAIEFAYQNNHSTTFLIDLGDSLDPRILYNRPNNGVFVFGDFNFNTSINQINASEVRYSGKISIVTSVIFNYVQFQGIFNQPSNYSPNITTNTDFTSILSSVNPQSVEYGYKLNNRFSNIGQSVSTQDDLGNTKKTWKLQFFCEESEWLELITFYRKKGGIGIFGIPTEGYLKNGQQQLINATFDTELENDSVRYQKQIGNVYSIVFNIIEVK